MIKIPAFTIFVSAGFFIFGEQFPLIYNLINYGIMEYMIERYTSGHEETPVGDNRGNYEKSMCNLIVKSSCHM